MAAMTAMAALRLQCAAAVLVLVAAGATARGEAGTAAGEDAGRQRRGLVRFKLSELQAAAPATRARLRWVLRREGAVLLTDVPGLSDTAAEALDALSDCFRGLEAKEPSSSASARPVVSPALTRGGVERWTLAASTRAGSTAPLPDWTAQECPGLPRPAEKLRGFVSLLLLHFAHSADAAAAPPEAAAASPEVAPAAAAAAGVRRGAGFLPAPAPPGAEPQRASLEDLVRRGTLLEHFHRYRRGAAPQGAAARRPLGMHTDAGLLQALAVRWRTRPGGTAAAAAAVGLEVELPGGVVVEAEEAVASSASVAEGAGERAGGLLLLLGQATEEWLPHLRLRAAPHALAATSAAVDSGSAERLVYGVMVLPPDDWQIAAAPGAGNDTTFGEWWRRAQLAVAGGPSGLPGREARHEEDELGEEEAGEGCLSSLLLQRRLRDQAHTCPEGSIYCWMQCQSVPSELPCKAGRAVCMSASTGAICPDDGTHDASCKPACPAGGSASFEILGAGEPGVNGAYRSNGWTGSKRSYIKPPIQVGGLRAQVVWDDYWASPHFGQWVIFAPGYKNDVALYYGVSDGESPPAAGWQVDAGASPTPVLDFNHSSNGHGVMPGEGFCNGVLTDMHMLGFTTAGLDDPCLIFLFSGWALTGPARFWCAVGGAVVAGIFAEWLVAVRRWEASWRLVPKAAAGRFSKRRLGRQMCRSALYALTRCMGYLVMLVTMTYSVELFVAVILGLTMGHALFNSASTPGEDISLCCQGGGTGRPAVVPETALRLRFKVTGMTCDSCCGTVRRAVESVSGVLGVEALSLASGEMLVAMDAPGRGGAGACAAAEGRDSACGGQAERIHSVVEAVGFSTELLGVAAVSHQVR